MKAQLAYKSIKVMVGIALALQWPALGRCNFSPIALTPDSYNQDVVVERTAPPPLVPVTTASMEGGLANNGFTWYERGYRPDWPTSGLPKAGTPHDSEAASDHQYQFAPSYKDNNVLLIDSILTNGSFTINGPATYVTLSFLVSGGNGGASVAFAIHHQDGAAQPGVFLCPDWLNGPNAAFTTAGRINLDTFAFKMDPRNPRLYANDVAVTNTSSPVTSIDFVYVSGVGQAAIFAVSGCSRAGEFFTPLVVTGYNQDIVVEAASTYPCFLAGVTTAAMEDGAANSGNTWYEQGYYSPLPKTGLPPAGASLTALSAADHLYTLAPSYTNNNVVLIDAGAPTASLTPVVPTRCAQLSFLTAAGHGPVTNQCIVQHVDGSSETNRFVAPDWLDTASGAFSANGRVELTQRLVSSLNANGPNLFASDINVSNSVSPITNLVVSFVGGGLNSHAVIFAVSGSQVAAPPVTAVKLSIRPSGDGAWILSSSAPGQLQWTTVLQGDRTVWNSAGQISSSMRIEPAGTDGARFYRVVTP